MNVSRMLWPEEQAHCVGPIKIVPVTELFFHLHDSMNSTAELDHCPQLPLELSDHVIDCLHGDHQALSTCSLVCRGWLPRAQYHLFERVSLSPYNWQAFEKLMISSPHIGVLVRNLDISHKFTYHGGAPAQEVEGMTRMVEVFPMITARLHAVTRLDLCVVDIPKWIDVLTGLRTVKELRLVRCIVPTLTELAKLICAFPHLKKLKIGDLFVVEAFGEEDNEEENVDISPIALKVPSMLRPTIEALRFPSCFLWHDAPSMGLMKWLLSESLHTHIDTLEVTVSRHRDAALLRGFSQELGPGLKHLYFSLRPDNWREGTFVVTVNVGCKLICLLRSLRNTHDLSPLHRSPHVGILVVELAHRSTMCSSPSCVGPTSSVTVECSSLGTCPLPCPSWGSWTRGFGCPRLGTGGRYPLRPRLCQSASSHLRNLSWRRH